MKGSDLNLLNYAQLQEKLEEVRRELFSFRLNAVTAHVKDYSQFAKKRKTIAQLLTRMTTIQSKTGNKSVKGL
jgi:ribosomal protein L29